MDKKKILKRISIIILIIICIASVSFAAITAAQVNYNKNGTTVSVKDALDELHTEVANAPKKVFSQGQLVNYKGEQFYALYDVSSVDTTMEIFAKTNLKLDATAQENLPYQQTACAFSSSRYWDKYGLNLNNITGYIVGDAMDKVNIYAMAKGVISGRLLTKGEVEKLTGVTGTSSWGSMANTKIKDMINGSANSQGYESYWLGSGHENQKDNVWRVYGNSSCMAVSSCTGALISGVRPVLTVYKSEVTPVE